MEQPNGVLLAANARTLPSSCHRSARSRRSAARLGWARRKPDSLFADRCYGHDVDRDQLCERGIVPAIARRGTWHGGGRLAPTGGRSGGPTVDPHHDRQLRRSEVGAPHVHHQALQPVAGLSCRRRQVWWSAAERGGVPDPVPAGHRHGRHRMGVSPPASPTDRPRQALLPQLECHGPPSAAVEAPRHAPKATIKPGSVQDLCPSCATAPLKPAVFATRSRTVSQSSHAREAHRLPTIADLEPKQARSDDPRRQRHADQGQPRTAIGPKPSYWHRHRQWCRRRHDARSRLRRASLLPGRRTGTRP
jgi:hypothetical protein